jgi:hypothetical protein
MILKNTKIGPNIPVKVFRFAPPNKIYPQKPIQEKLQDKLMPF